MSLIEPVADGFDLHLSIDERELLASLPGQLVELLDANDPDDPALQRLFPDAYSAADSDHAEEYRRLMTEDLRERHRIALETLAAGAHAEHLSGDDLYAWMTALTQLRLVIGTRIGVTEDWEPEADDATAGVYSYLSWLQDQVVAALAQQL